MGVVPKSRVVWMDPFDVKCCSSKTLKKVAWRQAWVIEFMKAPEKFTKGKWFATYRCVNCGRFWFKFKEGFWTVK